MHTRKTLWLHGKLVCMTDSNQHVIIEDGAMFTENQHIAWIGRYDEIPQHYLNTQINTVDLEGKLVTPGLIDCHTHVVFGGNRANEFSQKLQGVSYETLLKQGGGIYATVKATRLASEAELLHVSTKRVANFLTQGVTCLEIKSGYGLDLDTERKMLRVARAIANKLPLYISTTFLGAHVIAPEFSDHKHYIDYLMNDVLPVLVDEGLVDAMDAFCDAVAFDFATLLPLYQKAKSLGLGLKIHSDQLSQSDGAKQLAPMHAWSAEHLEYIDEAGVQALQQYGTVAVLLPAAYYYLREQHLPRIDLLRKYQVPIALATDCNPGSSPCLSLLTILNMACLLFRFTPFEALAAVTRHAAQALGLKHRKGQLKVGYDADFVIWDAGHPDELAYYIGAQLCEKVIIKGNIVYDAATTPIQSLY